MRIVFVINDLRTGGAERVFSEDANALARAGHEVTVCLLYGSISEDAFAKVLLPKVRRVELRARGPFDRTAFKHFRTLVRETKPNTCISTLNDASLFTRTALIGVREIRYIRREANELSMKPWWHRIIDLLCDWRADAVIAVSEHIAAGIRRYDPWVAASIAVIPNAVAIPAASAHPDSHFRILAVGSLTPKKDFETLIRACGRLRRSGFSFALTIAGDGSERSRLEDLARNEQVADEITFAGQLSHSAVEELYRESSLFVLTSLTEGSPNALLEAMAAGLSSVASDIPSVREVLDSESGILVPPSDAEAFASALERLSAGNGLRARMGAHARGIIKQRFDPVQRLDALEEILYGNH